MELPDLRNMETKEIACAGCTNQCSVTRFGFSNGNICYSGNKCEKVFSNHASKQPKGFNGFDLKNQLLFPHPPSANYQLLTINYQLTIGFPRALNLYEHFPFWQTLFLECGFKPVLSPPSDYSLYQKGAGSVMSDSICFPAKLAHGHIMALIEAKVDAIFYPIVPKDKKEFTLAHNSYNCPIVSGYPDVINSAVDPLDGHGITLHKPVINFGNEKTLKKSCQRYFTSLGTDPKTFRRAYKMALQAQYRVKSQLCIEQKKRLDEAICKGRLVTVVCGRPYHADPLINQKVGQILSDLGIDAFTEDVFSATDTDFGNLNLISQWSYPNRAVQAAIEVAKLPQNVQLIQLNSFGCGPDSFFMDEMGEILKQAGKNHTVLRIDEMATPGAIRLRLRSLVESLRERSLPTKPKPNPNQTYQGYQTFYKKEDRDKTILTPWFADYLSPFVPHIGALAGYRVENVPKTTKESVELGLKYGHNEVCYPATIVLGDFLYALQSGKYDPGHVALAIPQTGGQCRATNYVAQLKTGLTNAGYQGIPLVVLATGEVFQNEQQAFTFPYLKMAKAIFDTVFYADALQLMYSAVAVREIQKGNAQHTLDAYIARGIEAIRGNRSNALTALLEEAVSEFNHIPVHPKNYTKVGFIGEIYIKYNDYSQNFIRAWLREQSIEVVTPPLLDFFIQLWVNEKTNRKNGLIQNTLWDRFLNHLSWTYIKHQIEKTERIMRHSRYVHPEIPIFKKAEYAAEILDLCHQCGEGWLIAAQIACYAQEGIERFVCVQPFGCISNQIVAKGIEKRIKKFYPNVSLLYLDFDSSIADVHLQNRLHFLIK